MSNWNHTHCFFQPPTEPGRMGTLVDVIQPDTGLSYFSSEDLHQVAMRHPGVEVWLIQAVQDFREQVGRTEPEEITREQWTEALEVLPPNYWEHRGPFESFQCSEHFSGRLTATYLRRGSRCWTFRDVAGIGIDAIIERVRQHIAVHGKQEQAA